MKKLLLAIITLTIITLNGCYDPDTATVRINLGNMPIAKHEPKSFIDRIMGLFVKEARAQTGPDILDTIHIAAYRNETTILAQSYLKEDINVENNTSFVEIDVPAGDDVTLLAVGSINGYGEYCGKVTADIKADITNNITIQCYTEDIWLSGIEEEVNLKYDTTKKMLRWNSIGIPGKYRLRQNNEQVVYEGGNRYYSVEQGPCNDMQFNLYIYYEPFDIISSNNILGTVTGLGICK